MTSLILELITIVLLMATIGYAYILNRRIQLIHSNRDELSILLNGFTSALSKAEVSVETLRTSGYDAINSLKGSLDEARILREDLQFLVDRGEEVANQLESGIRKKRVSNTVKPFSQHLGPAIPDNMIDIKDLANPDTDDQVISDMKKKLIGRLRTLK